MRRTTMIDDIKTCDAFIIKLLKIEDTPDKKAALFQADDVVDALMRLKTDEPMQFERILEEISEQFPKSKTNTLKTLKDIIDDKQKAQVKKHLNEFTDADLTNLPIKNGQLVPTSESLRAVLLGAKRIKSVFDTMSNKTYFTRIDWEPCDTTVNIPIMSGDDSIYHKYTDSQTNQTGLKMALNRGAFPTEVSFSQLEDAVEFVSHTNEVDFCKDWINSCEKWDGVERQKGNNNFLVK